MSEEESIEKALRRRQIWRELGVGVLFLSAIALLAAFFWFLGAFRPFRSQIQYQVLYRFVGGAEVGAPVRVSGVKVGQIEKMDFMGINDSGASVNVTIGVSEAASRGVRKDSKFFINMAGIIGERYLEITPGSGESEVLPPGSVVRGEDPPRIDQLLSQGYGVFGQVQDFLTENEELIKSFMGELRSLLKEANLMLKAKERKQLTTLLTNLVLITDDVKGFTSTLKDEKSKKFFEELVTIVSRLQHLDEKSIRKFLQEEGIRTRVF